jgi:cell division protein FtsL
LALDALESVIVATSGSAAANQLLKKVHYSQLINFDFKFASKKRVCLSICIVTTADSMIQNNGKCFIHVKMELLNERNEKETVYAELTLE